MATTSSYINGYGDKVVFTVDLRPDRTGTAPYAAAVSYSGSDKLLQCQMYGPDSNHPADPVGQLNFIRSLAAALALDAQTNPDAPAPAISAFAMKSRERAILCSKTSNRGW
jgi:hypothetical protein